MSRVYEQIFESVITKKIVTTKESKSDIDPLS